ncbi:hypothetical protein [Kitasatospora sp. NPDC056184]|uniref:hypothetical protein n=1 Tax=Kitasatospora sp. NPDC056184 TaxID=3345738 RepID=UPI0035E3A0B7
MGSDPVAVGSAEQPIGATARAVLLERGLTVEENAKVPALVKQAQKARAPRLNGADGTLRIPPGDRPRARLQRARRHQRL